MKTLTAFILTVFFISNAHAQHFFAEVKAGAFSYGGDLQDKPVIKQMLRPAWSLGFNYEIFSNLIVNGSFSSGKIAGDDRYNPLSVARNLRFESNITEGSIGLEYNFLNLYKHRFSPFVHASFGLYKFNPYLDAQDGNRYYLVNYSTEGQGFYKGREKYKLIQYCIPFGGGFQYAFSSNVRLGLLISTRKIFTDYLDDCSTTYVDSTLLSTNALAMSPLLAYQGSLLNGASQYPRDGALRGNPGNNDSYSFLGFFLKFRLSPNENKDGFSGMGLKKVRTTCPTAF